MNTFENMLDKVSKKLDEFDNKIRYVIRGKAGTEYEGLAYGLGFADEQSDLVYLYDEKWQAEEALAIFAKSFAVNSGKNAYDYFCIHEVGKDELHSTFKKAHII